MTSWRVSLWLPPPRGPRPAEHKGFGAERSGQRRRLSRSVPNFPHRGGSSDGAIAGRRSNLRAGRRVFPARPPPPRALCSRVHVARRRFAKSSEPECGWTDRPPRRQVGEPRSIASRRAGRGLQAVARPAAATGCATARGNGSRATNRGVPVPSSSRPLTNFGALTNYEAWQEVPEVQPAGLGVELKRLPLVSFCKTADGAHVPLQARRSRARRLRLCAAAGAARTCVARLQPPRPLTRWPSPRRRGPRSPCDDLCGPAECPTSTRSSMPTTTYAQNQHLPVIRWRSG